MLIDEGYLNEALIKFELSEFLVDSVCPQRVTHCLPERLRDRGVLKSDSECEVLCLDIREVNLIAGR